jgi:ketosteroid isomerase-like protein
MFEDNLALVRCFESHWAQRDLEAALECVHDDIEFDWSNSMGPSMGTYGGHEGFTRFWADMLDAWDDFRPESVEAFECGPEQLITVDVVRARGKGSGIEMESRGAMLWTVRDGKIVRATMFQTKHDALAAMRLTR